MKKKYYFKIVLIILLISTGISTTLVNANGEINLTKAYNIAKQYDTTLSKEKAKFEASTYETSISRSALLPQISLDGNVRKQDDSRSSLDVTTQTLSINLKQSLYQQEHWSRYQQAKYNVSKAKLSFKIVQQNLITRIATIYFKILISQQDLYIAKSKELSDKTQWRTTKLSAKIGLSNQIDVLQAKSNYDLAISETISATNNLETNIEEFKKLTNGTVPKLKKLQKSYKIPTLKYKTMEQWITQAKTNSFAIMQAKMQQDISLKQLSIERSKHLLPNIDLKAQYSDNNYLDSSNNPLFQNNSQLSVGVYVSIPLYLGGRVNSKIEQAKSNITLNNNTLKEVINDTKLNVRTLFRKIETGKLLVIALRKAVKSSDKFLKTAQEGYQLGSKTLLEILSAKTIFFTSTKKLSEASHNLVLNQLKLEATTGILTPESLNKYDLILVNSN